MAKIKHIYTCPKCEESIPSSVKPEACPGCGARFPADGARGFITPETITEQNDRLLDNIGHMQFVLDLSIESANNILNDALNIVETIPGKKVKVSDIRKLMGMAIRIGEIAKKYEDFLAAGGSHTPGLFIKSGDTDELQKTGDGAKTSRPVPTPLFPPVGNSNGSGDDLIPR